MPPKFCLEGIDDENSVSMTWSIDSDGTLHHKASGMRISQRDGIVVEGTEYRLSPQDSYKPFSVSAFQGLKGSI